MGIENAKSRKSENLFPSAKAEKRLKQQVHERTTSRNNFKPVSQVVAEVNAVVRGWGNYFRLGYPSRVFDRVNWDQGALSVDTGPKGRQWISRMKLLPSRVTSISSSAYSTVLDLCVLLS